MTRQEIMDQIASKSNVISQDGLSKRRESKMQSERHRRSKITGLISLIAKVVPGAMLPVGYVS